MGKGLAVFTIIARNYLAHARVLMHSVAHLAPDALRIVVLVDDPEGHFNPDEEPFETVPSTVLAIPKSRWFHFKYSILELSTAVKPYAFEWISQSYEVQQIVYLDPDICLFGSLAPLQRKLQTASLVLTPHLTGALPLDGRPNEISILRAGAYNLGFLAVSMGEESLRFLHWWQQRLYDHCVVDPANGLFVDQKWIDLVPGLYDGVAIERHPGYNVAYWNLPCRSLVRDGAQYLVHDAVHNAGGTAWPLVFFHFSGFDPCRPKVISKHQDRLRMSDLGVAGERLFQEYANSLLDAGYSECIRWSYGNSRFANGRPVLDIGRPLYKEIPDFANRVEDPFSDAGYREFVNLWNTPVPLFSGHASGLTRLGLHIYKTRQDVQAVMPDLLGGDRIRYLEWLLSSGRNEHNLSDELLTSAVEAVSLATASPCAPAVASKEGQSGRTSSLYDFIERLFLSRSDLGRRFPDPFGRDSAAFLVWLSTYGVVEHPVVGEVKELLIRQRDEVLSKQRPWRRLQLRAWMGRLHLSATICRQIRILAGTHQSPLPLMGLTFQDDPAVDVLRKEKAANTAGGGELGVNLIGYLRTQNGVGQSARNAVAALQAAAIPYRLHNLRSQGLREGDDSLELDSGDGTDFGINLYVVNADQTAVASAETAELRKPGRYNVGTWVWELSVLPAIWSGAFGSYDEIWAPSAYCQAAIAARSPLPVVYMPYVVELPAPSQLGRPDFGMSADRFVFLAIFDMRSVFERKNPLAVISAFARAFRPEDQCELVIKINHAEAAPGKMELLRAAAAGRPIRLLVDTIPYPDVVALMQASDCIVSLHRAEGFGFVMAEGMLLGKPVIATGYSGNVDFTLPSNSFLVGYKLCPVGPGCEPYDPEALWAEPSEEEAIAQMQLVVRDEVLRRERAEAGRRFIQENYSSAAVGARYRERCNWIGARNGFVPVLNPELEVV